MHDKTLLKKVVQAFRRDIQNQVRDLSKAMELDDLILMQGVVHRVRGSR